MNREPWLKRLEQRSQSILTLMLFVLVILLIQLWLITIALEEFLAARHSLAIPTFLASGACFALNLWLLHYLADVDRAE
ncbi:MAG TPA: DUF6755 family protein [Armatimonadota bacterium]|jgi:hypothetical protein